MEYTPKFSPKHSLNLKIPHKNPSEIEYVFEEIPKSWHLHGFHGWKIIVYGCIDVLMLGVGVGFNMDSNMRKCYSI